MGSVASGLVSVPTMAESADGNMRIGIIGGGVIARLVLEHSGALGDVQVVAIAGAARNRRARRSPRPSAFRSSSAWRRWRR